MIKTYYPVLITFTFKESRNEEIQIATVFTNSVHYEEEYLVNGDKI